MITDNKEIKSGEGLGKIKFGMTREQLEKLIGEPDEIEDFSYSSDEDDDLVNEDEDNEEDEDAQTELWHYDNLELSVSFDEEVDWRLVNIAVSSSDYTFKGEKIIGLGRAELLDTLKKLGLTNLKQEDHSSKESPNHKLVASEALGINFWLENDVLAEMQWGPLFIDDDTIVWPK